MSGSFDNLLRLQSLDEGEYGNISAGLRPPHSIFTKPEVFNGLGHVPLAQWMSAVDPVTAYHRRAAPCARIIHLVTCRSQ
jgi:hypothetical protein